MLCSNGLTTDCIHRQPGACVILVLHELCRLLLIITAQLHIYGDGAEYNITKYNGKPFAWHDRRVKKGCGVPPFNLRPGRWLCQMSEVPGDTQRWHDLLPKTPPAAQQPQGYTLRCLLPSLATTVCGIFHTIQKEFVVGQGNISILSEYRDMRVDRFFGYFLVLF